MPFQWSVVVGFVPDCSSSLEMTYPVQNIVFNEGPDNNVALVELMQGPELSEYINLVQFNMYNYDFVPDTQCSVVGWDTENGTCKCLLALVIITYIIFITHKSSLDESVI